MTSAICNWNILGVFVPGQGRLGDKASVPVDTHGCPACPHEAIGPAIAGSPDVNVNGGPALRVDDPGMHAPCCGTGTWVATRGSATVFINGKPAHRIGDQNRHCGGLGQLVEGSSNVIVEGGNTSADATVRTNAVPHHSGAPIGARSGDGGPRADSASGMHRGADRGGDREPTAASSNSSPGPASTAAPRPTTPSTGDLIVAVASPAGALDRAIVRITGAVNQEGQTDRLGVARFTAIPTGDYQISASRVGFHPGAASATTAVGQATTSRVTLRPIITILSQTVATSPPNRARTRIGIGEEVNLSVADGPARWTIEGSGRLLNTSGTSVVFRAGDRASCTTITATVAGASGTITLDIIEPSGFRMEVASAIKHRTGRPDCGFLAKLFLEPVDVSFEHVEIRERNSTGTGTGFYAPFHGCTHQPADWITSPPFTVNPPEIDGKGSFPNVLDLVHSGDTGGRFAAGALTFPIVWEFRVRSGVFKAMPTNEQCHKTDVVGNCTTFKADAMAIRIPEDATAKPF